MIDAYIARRDDRRLGTGWIRMRDLSFKRCDPSRAKGKC